MFLCISPEIILAIILLCTYCNTSILFKRKWKRYSGVIKDMSAEAGISGQNQPSPHVSCHDLGRVKSVVSVFSSITGDGHIISLGNLGKEVSIFLKKKLYIVLKRWPFIQKVFTDCY